MIADWAARYVGIPYRDGGRDHDGIDCYGLVRLIYRDVFARAVPEYRYASALDRGTVERIAHDNLNADWRPIQMPVAGAFIMLRILGRPWHCGIAVGPRTMLHAPDTGTTCIERLDNPRWAKRVLGYFEMRHAG